MNEKITIPIPALHSNGSGAKNLINGAMAIHEGLKTTLDAMRQNRPHGRDYYTMGPNALKEAQDAHKTLELRTLEIYESYQEFIIAIKYGKS